MKCQTCRDKDAELLTWWERTRNWFFLRTNHVLYPQDFDDLKSEQYTKGFADGLTRGLSMERANQELMRARFPEPSIDVEGAVDKRMNELLSPIDHKRIVTLDSKAGAIYIGGNRADEGRLLNLKQEAEALERFDLWGIIHETPKELAQRAMFVAGDSIEEMRKGRAMLYTLDTQRRILDTFKSYTQPQKKS